ncbi:hypothetical protein M422DRAFT_222170 [Sphaerobolus stellatus SS14]|nr:hypothetical protein M422DRAFT_222170 [Sphaerobolus stellatus SS14]
MSFYYIHNNFTDFNEKDDELEVHSGLQLNPRDQANPVVESARFVQKHIDLVRINEEGVKAAARHIYSTILKEGYSPHTWRHHPLHFQPPEEYSPDDPRTKACLDWIFLISSLNFSFWSDKEGTEEESRRFGVEWHSGWGQQDTKVWTGYWSLVASINRALERGIPITDPTFYASKEACPDSLIEEIFKPAPHCCESVPLLRERIATMREVGSILVSKFGGSYAGLLMYFIARHSGQGTALQLVQMIVDEFPPFRDETTFEGETVLLWKRAQILIAETWAAFYPSPTSASAHPFFPYGVGQLTMFADYRVPQILHHLRIMDYSLSLVALLKSRTYLAPGSRPEVCIRAASILAVEAVRDEIANMQRASGADLNNTTLIPGHSEVPSVLIDFFLWDLAKKVERGEEKIEGLETSEMVPAHRTRSIWY